MNRPPLSPWCLILGLLALLACAGCSPGDAPNPTLDPEEQGQATPPEQPPDQPLDQRPDRGAASEPAQESRPIPDPPPPSSPQEASKPTPGEAVSDAQETGETDSQDATGLTAAYQMAVSGDLPGKLATMELHEKMEQVDESFFDVEQGIKKGSTDVLAERLTLIVQLLRSARGDIEEDRYRQFSDGMMERLGRLAKALDDGGVTRVSRAMADVGAQCKACHEVYKKKKKR